MTAPAPGRLAGIASRIWDGSRAARFRGSDPYDGLNSRLLAPLLGSRFARLAVIQAVKDCPVNLRRLIGVGPGLNPKALALFRAGASDLPSLAGTGQEGPWIDDSLFSMASLPDGAPAFAPRREHTPGIAVSVAAQAAGRATAFGWGYDFPWQGRAFYQPAFAPTVVTTGFVTEALVAAGSPAAPAALSGSAGFVAGCLERYECSQGLCFSYSPTDRTRVYNASLFGARILVRAGIDADAAIAAADFVTSRQGEDGSWAYGEASHWRWVDNFHTGYVLQLLEELSRALGTDRWDGSIRRGAAFYRSRLFLEDGTARNSASGTYPLDPHSFAQGIMTFLALERHCPDAVDFSLEIAGKAIERLWDDRRGGFIHRRGRLLSDRAVHMRWSQAWMFRALCALVRRTGAAL